MYTMLNPRTGERHKFATLAEMINAWVTARHCVMTTAGLTQAEHQAINNIYALGDQLRDSQRQLSRSTLRAYSCDETAVL